MTGILMGMPEPEPGDLRLRRLGKRVATERLERGWSKAAAARRAVVSVTTWSRVEDGESLQDTKYAAIAGAFGWKSDGLYRIMDDLEPEPLDEPDEPEPEPQNHYAEELQERYDLEPEDAEAAAVLIRALRRKRGNSPGQSKKQA